MALTARFRRDGGRIAVDLQGTADACCILLVGIASVTSVEGGSVEETDRGVLLRPQVGTTSLVVGL